MTNYFSGINTNWLSGGLNSPFIRNNLSIIAIILIVMFIGFKLLSTNSKKISSLARR